MNCVIEFFCFSFVLFVVIIVALIVVMKWPILQERTVDYGVNVSLLLGMLISGYVSLYNGREVWAAPTILGILFINAEGRAGRKHGAASVPSTAIWLEA